MNVLDRTLNIILLKYKRNTPHLILPVVTNKHALFKYFCMNKKKKLIIFIQFGQSARRLMSTDKPESFNLEELTKKIEEMKNAGQTPDAALEEMYVTCKH